MNPKLQKYMIARQASHKVQELARQFKAVAILGPRQSGKTTLSRTTFPEKPYVSLENPDSRHFATEDPRGFLAQFPDGAILDEIQRTPDILSYLQQVLDEDSRRGKFVLTGSNNFLLVQSLTQSLAGRVAYLDLLPLSLTELKPLENALIDVDTCIYQGGYPALWAEGIQATNWFPAYMRTYVERDVRIIRNLENLSAFEKTIALCAGRIGQLLNRQNIATEAGVSDKTVEAWLGILQASYIVFLLPPWFQNYNKRVVKAPKLYFYDTGLACYLLGIRRPEDIRLHPFRGALFENLIVLEMLKKRFNAGERSNLFHWRDSTGNEIDVLVENGLIQYPVEIKSSQTITDSFFKGLRYWEKLSQQSGGAVVYGGPDTQHRSGFHVLPWYDADRIGLL
ncbi:MAG: ATP-binding protein [Chitinophagales bacterium]|nr:ATP-binding protein [Chitinophagales bacterium]